MYACICNANRSTQEHCKQIQIGVTAIENIELERQINFHIKLQGIHNLL